MLELGLHRKHSLLKNIPNDRMRTWAVRLFWCIYILDRRWSIGLSLPFALQDADIDPELLQPVGSDHQPANAEVAMLTAGPGF
jgi:hypothetical protein